MILIIIIISLITLFVAPELNYKSVQSTSHIYINVKHFTRNVYM